MCKWYLTNLVLRLHSSVILYCHTHYTYFIAVYKRRENGKVHIVIYVYIVQCILHVVHCVLCIRNVHYYIIHCTLYTQCGMCVTDESQCLTLIPLSEKYDVNPVIRQLECGLPHEVQFGLNMLLWMTKSWPLPLPKYPRLLSVLLANTGLHEPESAE